MTNTVEKQPVEFFGFVESGYPQIPYSGDRPSKTAYIDLPNSHYDPIQGQRNMETQLEVLASMEQYGLDGALFSEQHNGPIGTIANGLVGAAWLAARTDRIKIVVGGPIMNAYQSPIRLAEEIAVVDTMSKGRLMIGLPMGLGQAYHSLGMNPATARERHKESHDLLVKALNEPGPFTWRGRFFNHNYVNIWPRPAHKVEFIMPSGGSLETMELCAKRGYAYQTLLKHRPSMIATMNRFRDLCRKEGYEPDPRQSVAVVELHVAETDEIACREVEAQLLWNYQSYFESAYTELFPPGYTSTRSMRAILSEGYGTDTKTMTLKDLTDNNWAIVGSPRTVIEKLEELIGETGAGRVILWFTTGIKQRWLLDKCLTLFSEEVLPHFRKSGLPLSESEPRYGFRSSLEYEAKRRKDVPPPTIVKDGYLVDVYRHSIDPEGARLHPWPRKEGVAQ